MEPAKAGHLSGLILTADFVGMTLGAASFVGLYLGEAPHGAARAMAVTAAAIALVLVATARLSRASLAHGSSRPALRA